MLLKDIDARPPYFLVFESVLVGESGELVGTNAAPEFEASALFTDGIEGCKDVGARAEV